MADYCENCGLPLRVKNRTFYSRSCQREHNKEIWNSNGAMDEASAPINTHGQARRCDFDYNGTYKDGWLDDAIKIIENG